MNWHQNIDNVLDWICGYQLESNSEVSLATHLPCCKQHTRNVPKFTLGTSVRPLDPSGRAKRVVLNVAKLFGCGELSPWAGQPPGLPALNLSPFHRPQGSGSSSRVPRSLLVLRSIFRLGRTTTQRIETRLFIESKSTSKVLEFMKDILCMFFRHVPYESTTFFRPDHRCTDSKFRQIPVVIKHSVSITHSWRTLPPSF